MTGQRRTAPVRSPAPVVSKPPTVRRLIWAVIGVGIIVGAIETAFSFVTSAKITSGASLSAGAVAAGACSLTGLRARGVHRRWRLLFAVGCLGFAIASVAVFHATFGTTSGPANAWLQFFGLAVLYPCALAGLLTFPTRAREQPLLALAQSSGSPPPADYRWWTVVVLDSLVVVGSLAYLGWLVLGGSLQQMVLGPVQLNVMVTATVGNFVLLAAAVLVASFRRARSGSGFGLLTWGIAALAGSNVALLVTTIENVPELIPVGTCGLLIGPLLIALSAVVAPAHDLADHDPADDDFDQDDGRALVTSPWANLGSGTGTDADRDAARLGAGLGRLWTHAVLPYVALAFVGVVTVVQLALGQSPTGAQTAVVVALLLIALLRQLVTLADNTRLLGRVQDSERRLHHLAFHDPLTGLANRALFTDRLEGAIARQGRDGRPLAVVYCDLDDFKHVNDTLGHEAGDEMLRATADRLLDAVRGSDTVARIGGDEFAVVLDGYDDPAGLARRLLAELHRPTELGGVWRSVRASIGVAVAEPSARPKAAALLRTADVAMYEAKEHGKGRVAIRRATDRTSSVHVPAGNAADSRRRHSPDQARDR